MSTHTVICLSLTLSIASCFLCAAIPVVSISTDALPLSWHMLHAIIFTKKENSSRLAKLICTPEETINRTKLRAKKGKRKISTSRGICEHADEMQIHSIIDSSCRLRQTQAIYIHGPIKNNFFSFSDCNTFEPCDISGLWRGAVQVLSLLWCYAVYDGSCFTDVSGKHIGPNLKSQAGKERTLQLGPIRCPGTSVSWHKPRSRNIPEQRLQLLKHFNSQNPIGTEKRITTNNSFLSVAPRRILPVNDEELTTEICLRNSKTKSW
jgi:hypothetical protein